MDQEIKVYFDQLRKAWNSPIVPRKLSGEASGRTISPKSLANLDCAGEGPEGAFKVGGGTVYPADNFFDWLEARARPVERKRRSVPEILT